MLDCGHNAIPSGPSTTGYGTDKSGKTSCYECCAELDKKYMREHGRLTMYDCDDEVTNWPGSLKFKVVGRKTSYHNFARTRHDFWFVFEGMWWHGYRCGDMTQIAHCKRTKDSI